jgi:1,4-alpha-glucan branching enzyme
MKILFICKSLPPKVCGGIQTHTWKLAGSLADLGHEVTIVYGGSMRAGTVYKIRDGRKLVQVPYLPGRKLPFFNDLVEEWAFNRSAFQWVSKNAGNYDIIHVQGRSGLLVPGRLSGTPVVTTFHGLLSLERNLSGFTGFKGIKGWLHEKWATFFERRALTQSDAVIAVSREMALELEQLAPLSGVEPQIISNGVDIISPVATKNDPRLLLFVGRLHRIKGIFTLIQAMKLVDKAVKLVIVGDGPERRAVETAIESAGLSHRITLTGALDQAGVFQWIQQAAALVVPSFHETQGIVLLEAFTNGRPVIASDIPAIRDIVQPGINGFLVPPGNIAALARSMNQMTSQPGLAFIMGQNGRVLVIQRFDWEEIALQTEQLYGRVLANKFNENLHQVLRRNTALFVS